ncbi:MAG TPA: hypothetical protein VGZ03_04690, partial [Acidimicrobiales bacterium]|nr:hypothetical protein [Acidimicrobiales bacterium]
MATGRLVRRGARAGIAEGALVLAALACVPAALVAALDAPVTAGFATLVDALVAVAVVSWVIVLAGLGRLVAEQLRGGDTKSVERGPLGWAAIRVVALILCVAPFLEHAGHGSASPRGGSGGGARPRSGAITLELATRPPTAARHRGIDDGRVRDDVATGAVSPAAPRDPSSSRHGARGSHRCRPAPASPLPLGTGAILVPLAADARRRARLARRVVVDDEGAVDVETALLSSPAPPTSLLVGAARALAAAGLLARSHVVLTEGEAWLDDGTWRFDPGAAQVDARCLCVVLGEAHGRTHVVFVPRGGVLVLQGPGAVTLVDDAIRVSPALGLGRPVRTAPSGLLHALAVREDDD